MNPLRFRHHKLSLAWRDLWYVRNKFQQSLADPKVWRSSWNLTQQPRESLMLATKSWWWKIPFCTYCAATCKKPLKRDLKEQHCLVVLDLTLLINLPLSCSFCELLNFFINIFPSRSLVGTWDIILIYNFNFFSRLWIAYNSNLCSRWISLYDLKLMIYAKIWE